MNSLPASLWITTALCLAGLCVGMVFHLKWHPLRRHFSDAWDLMLAFPWLTLATAALWLLSGAGDLRAHMGPWSLNELLAWPEMAAPLLQYAATVFARSLHQLFPAWPLALLLPLALSVLLQRLVWRPYRYGSRQLSVPLRTLLGSAAAFSWIWVGMELGSATRALPEWFESVRLALRFLAIAATTAGCQVLLMRLMIGWEHPEHPDHQRDAARAVEHTMARWQSIFGLTAFDLLWLLWRDAPQATAPVWRDWLLPELLLVFAPLPLAVALIPGSFIHQGGCAIRALRRSILALLATGVTAVAVLMLVHYAVALVAHAAAGHGIAAMFFLPAHALVLATVHNWLFLAAVFTLLRHGFHADSSRSRAD